MIRIVATNAIAVAVLGVALVGGYALFTPFFSQSITISKVEHDATRQVDWAATTQGMEQAETTGREELRRKIEQSPAVVALREQLAEAEREAARKREQEEHRQAAERERQAAEREAALRLERTCKRDEDSLARLKAAGPTAGDDVVRFEQGLGCERIRPAVVALREQLAEAEREAARKREQEERRQAAERERVAVEREAALRLERTCKRDEDSLARLKAAGPAAGDDVVRFEQGLGCERIRPAVVALREQLVCRL